ncbi:unnamed protein product, partial [Mesorhabditis spiculigera]
MGVYGPQLPYRIEMTLKAVVLFVAISLTPTLAYYCPAVLDSHGVGPSLDGFCSNDGSLFCGYELASLGSLSCYSTHQCVTIQNPEPMRILGPSLGVHCLPSTSTTCILVNGERQCYDLTEYETCTDKDPNCLLYLHNGYCRSKLYTTAEKKNSCCQTCGFDTACQDADPNCPLYENNSKYCNSTAFAEDQKISKCKKTCGVC